ncbi:hypothetical protein BDZ91DRAFT_736678 [Kalaharituber pfeilii]|nr:hypothetical protein BDZ91DRAFT_736678 [Kalaharituber pfeilii]
MEAVNAFNFDILKSQFFKLTLGDEKQVGGSDGATTLFVHRELLASLSPELRKHIDNEMKEGLNGEMVLYDVDEVTVQCFLQWAYVRDYKISQATSNALLLHAKLYVFADRFNVGSLKDLSFQKLTSFLDEQSKPDCSLSANVLSTAKFAVENLPALTERLVDHLLRYIAKILHNVCDLAECEELVLAHPHAAMALIRLTRAEKLTAGSKSLDGTITETCVGCKMTEPILWIHCRSCMKGWTVMNWSEADRQVPRCPNVNCSKTGFLSYHCYREQSGCRWGPW